MMNEKVELNELMDNPAARVSGCSTEPSNLCLSIARSNWRAPPKRS